MGVTTFLQPDFPGQTAAVYKAAIDSSIAVLKRFGQAFAPHEQSTPDMTVALDAGFIWDGADVLTEVVAQSTTAITAPITNPRIDRVTVDEETGTVSVTTGVEAPSPSAPTIPDGGIPVAQIALTTSTTSITNNDITDERAMAGAGGGGVFGGTGDDGTVTIASNTTLNGIKNYNSLTIDPGVTLTHDIGRSLTIKVKRTLTVNGVISATGKGQAAGGGGSASTTSPGVGGAGAAGFYGGGGGGSGGHTVTLPAAGGGAGGTRVPVLSGGGAGGGVSASGGAGSAAHTAMSDSGGLYHVAVGGAGGGGGGGQGIIGGAGGRGAGIIIIEADNLIVNTGGSIVCNGNGGANGTQAGLNWSGAGGGGGGGLIVLRYRSLTEDGSVTASGGGGGSSGGRFGGVGGSGTIIREILP